MSLLASWVTKASTRVGTELDQLRLRRVVLSAMSRVLDRHAGNRTHVTLLRERGFAVGEGTEVHGTPHIVGAAEAAALSIGRDCVIELDCHFDLGDKITLGDSVVLGKQVMVITSSHAPGPKEQRAGLASVAPVNIGNGAWIGARATILPGVTIGAGAIVAPGALVDKDVEPNTRVAGSPAKRVEVLAT